VLTAALALVVGLTGCPNFGGDVYYTRPVTDAPVDAHSADYIRAMVAAGNTDGFWIAAHPIEYINLAGPRTPLYVVHPKVPYHKFDVRYPWRPSFRIEPRSDAHAIVVQTQSCELFESYGTTFSDGQLSAYSGAHWNLRAPFVPLDRGTPSAMASGLSLYAGMVLWEEANSGSIPHALNWAAPAGTVARYSFVRPASDTDRIVFKGVSDYRLPYGARLRLRASFDTSHFGPQSAAIAQAMKTYGIYLADSASTNELYNAMSMDGSNRWNPDDLRALGSIHITDFDVLSLGKVERVDEH
jgi:hypothetical protein